MSDNDDENETLQEDVDEVQAKAQASQVMQGQQVPVIRYIRYPTGVMMNPNMQVVHTSVPIQPYYGHCIVPQTYQHPQLQQERPQSLTQLMYIAVPTGSIPQLVPQQAYYIIRTPSHENQQVPEQVSEAHEQSVSQQAYYVVQPPISMPQPHLQQQNAQQPPEFQQTEHSAERSMQPPRAFTKSGTTYYVHLDENRAPISNPPIPELLPSQMYLPYNITVPYHIPPYSVPPCPMPSQVPYTDQQQRPMRHNSTPKHRCNAPRHHSLQPVPRSYSHQSRQYNTNQYQPHQSKSDSVIINSRRRTPRKFDFGFNEALKSDAKSQFSKCLELSVFKNNNSIEASDIHKSRVRKDEIQFKQDCKIFANHFAIKSPNISFTLYTLQISVSIKDRESKAIQDSKIRRKLLENLFARKYEKQEKKPIYIYDGVQLLFVSSDYEISEFDGTRISENADITYIYSINSTGRVLCLADLKKCIAEGTPRSRANEDGLSSMDVVSCIIKDMLTRQFQLFSRFYCDPSKACIDLKDGHLIFKGFTLDTRSSGDAMALIVNTTGCLMTKEQPLLDYIKVLFGANDLNFIRANLSKISVSLAGLKVTLTHLKQFKRSIAITRLDSRSAEQIKFEVEDKKEISVSEYFAEKYGKLQYPELPLVVDEKLNKEKIKKTCFYPMEVCQVLQIKSNVKERPSHQKDVILHTKETPSVKYQHIHASMKDIDGGKFKNIEFEISNEMKNITGQLIPLPVLQYQNELFTLDPQRKGSWKSEAKFFKPTTVKSVIVYSFIDEGLNGTVMTFFKCLAGTARAKGITWVNESVDFLYNIAYDQVVDALHALTESPAGSPDLVFFILETKNDFFDLFKTLSEVVFGLRSICVLEKIVREKKNDVLNNLCMKINERLDGINQTLVVDKNIERAFGADNTTMFVSADVAHLGLSQPGYPSLAVVLGSIDDHAKKYAVRMRAQWHERSWHKIEIKTGEMSSSEKQKAKKPMKQEIIVDLGTMIEDLLEIHLRKNAKIPDKIVYYRNAVSKIQQENVSNAEFMMIKDGVSVFLKKHNLKKAIKVTYIMVQKNHGTRLFFAKSRAGTENETIENPKPGTVVSSGICNPNESESYLLSHYMDNEKGGTLKPSNYKCIFDECDFTENELNSLHFYLCHLYARCNRSVRVPAPVYYTDLAVIRGMSYMKVSTDDNWRVAALNRYKERQQEGELQYFDIPIHANIKDEMFFI